MKSSRCPPSQLIPPKVLQADISSLLSPLRSKGAPPASPLRRSACSCWGAAGRSLKHPTPAAWCPYQVCGKHTDIVCPNKSGEAAQLQDHRHASLLPHQTRFDLSPSLVFPGGVLTAVPHVAPQRHMPSVSKCCLETLSLGLRLRMATWPTPKAVLSKEILLKNTLPSVLSTLYLLREVGGSRVGGRCVSC